MARNFVTSRSEQTSNIVGLRRSADAMAQVMAATGIGGKEGLQDVAVVIVNKVKTLLSQPGRGRIYRISGQRTIHQASAPGDPPAVVFGRLRSSYTWQAGQDAQGDFVDVGTNQKKAPHLEFGTRRMRPRPHLRPAIDQTKEAVSAAVASGIIAAQKGAARRLPTEIEI